MCTNQNSKANEFLRYTFTKLILPRKLLPKLLVTVHIYYLHPISGLENFEMENAVTIERSRYKMLRHIRMTPSINSVQTEEGNQVNITQALHEFDP